MDSPGKLAVGLPVDSWSQYILYSSVLDDGRARRVQGELHGHSTTSVSTKPGPAIVLCAFLLLCGDVHPNPGPRSLDICQSADPDISRSAKCAAFTGVGIRGNIPPINNIKPYSNVGQMTITSFLHRPPTLTTQTTSYLKQQQMKLFQTVNHASVLWDAKTKPKGIFGGHLNVRSIISKTEQLEHLLTDSNIDYLCLTETWLTPTTPLSVFNIPGYNVYRRDRRKGKGGGVLIYVKDSIQSQQIVFPENNLECVGVKLTLSPEMYFAVFAVYRPPTATNEFYDCLNVILKQYGKMEVILMGDFNLNWQDKTRRKKLKDIAKTFQMTQMIHKPTRITKSSQTLLDLIFTNKPDRIRKIYNLITGLSDHNLTLVSRKLSKTRFKNQNSMKGKSMPFIASKDMALIENEIKQINWHDTIGSLPCEPACADLMSTIKGIILKYTRKRGKKTNKKYNLPWFNINLWELMKKRDASLKKFLKSKLNTDHLIFKSLRNKVTQQLRKARANFFLNVISEAKGNSKKLWKSIDKLLGREKSANKHLKLMVDGCIQDDDKIIAECFNDYFINSVREMSLSSPKIQLTQALTCNDSAFKFSLINTEKVENVISLLSNSKAKDIYGCDTAFLKQHKTSIMIPLVMIINKSFNENIFPSVFKPAIVTPVHKSGDTQEVSNYRPISILPAASKVIEKVVAEQLIAHLDSKSFFHPMQFGFRKKHSTETACCYFLEEIKTSLDQGGVVGAVFLDLRKAFDTVNHEVLIHKLAKYDISTNVQNWIKSYLINRKQCVQINGTLSTSLVSTMGVPQGSILGPLLFCLYINDLPSVCKGINIVMYADDTVLYTHGRSATDVAKKLSSVMSKVSHWLHDSCLTLNVEKTVTMFFTNRFILKTYPEILVNGQLIKHVDKFKYLGVILDSTLSFKGHVKKLCNKLKFNLVNFRYIRNSLTTEASSTYLNAMIIPHFLYCITSWSQACKTVIKPLESLYKNCLKIHDKKTRYYHHCQILVKYDILSFDNLIKHSNVSLLHKIIYSATAPPLKKFVTLCSEKTVRTTRSVTRGECSFPQCKTQFGSSSFSCVAMRQWNTLPTEHILCTDSHTFSCLTKSWLLSKQVCTHL